MAKDSRKERNYWKSVKNLQIGRVYWYVTDYWEKFHAVPFVLEDMVFKWDLGNGDFEYFSTIPSSQRLFRRRKQALKAAAKLNLEMEATR